MAIGEIVEPREIVKADNELFRCKNKIKDVVAGRIFMAFASLVNEKDIKENQNFVEYKISASSILFNIDAGGDYYKQIKDAAYSLVDQKIEHRISKNDFAVYTLFSKIAYKNGIIIGEFHKDLVPFFILASGRFTKINFFEYIKLPSIYSQKLFCFLRSWSDKKIIIETIENLHHILDTPKTFRNNFTNFRVRVLEKAYKDINELTSISFRWKPIKECRSVTKIQFEIIKNNKPINYTDTSKTAFILKETLGIEIPEENNGTRYYSEFISKFTDSFGDRIKAGKIWFALREKNQAPLAKDVPDDNNLSLIEFLKVWEEKSVE